MKQLLTIAILLFMGLSVGANDSSKRLPQIKITDVTIKEADSHIAVTFKAFVSELNTNHKLTLTPILYGGSTNKALTPITIIGKKKSISEKRESAPLPSGIVGKKKQPISYSVSIPYEDWMNTISLSVNSTIEGCCTANDLSAQNIVTNKLIHYDIIPVYDATPLVPELSELQKFDIATPYLYPAKDYSLRHEILEKQMADGGALIIYFKQAATAIDPSYRNNENSLKEVKKVMSLIDADKNASLKKIIIVGLASPEGTVVKNNDLAQARATSLQRFVNESIKKHPDIFEIINGSENWSGLRKLVEASTMQYRDLVLSTMDKYTVRQGLEIKLMNLKGGRPYNYMFEHFFPDLRNAGYIQIYYDEKPDQNIKLINQAIDLIGEKKYTEALTILSEVTDEKRVSNAVGICHMMIGNYYKAEEYFNQAVRNGDEDAAENLTRLKIAQSIER